MIDKPEDTPMNRLAMLIRTFAVVALMTIAAISTTAAQGFKHGMMDDDQNPEIQQLRTELGEYVVSFWSPKMNEYKRRIDNTLAPSDVTELNRLRVRWGILLGALQNRLEQMQKEGDDDEVTFEYSEKDQATMMEAMSIYMAVQELAEHYTEDGGMVSVGNDVVSDLTSFVGGMSDYADRMEAVAQERYPTDMQAPVDDNMEAIADRVTFADRIEELQSKEGQESLRTIYGFALQPMIMLFNGNDLRDLLGSAMNLSSDISEATTGMEFPSTNALQQNYPNPASRSTTIAYTLALPSSKTILSIYNSRGEIVKTFEEGEQGVGEHKLTVNVSEFANGSYLYHLATQTEDGENVYSRVMQVVR